MSTVLITGADAAFFSLLEECVRSIRTRIPRSEMDLAVLDVGLTPEQRERLESSVDRFAVPEWDLRPADSAPDHMKAFDSRPLLPKYFADYETYVWIDADAWVQDRAAIDLLVQGARQRGCAISPELHPAYDPVFSNLSIRYKRFGRIRVDSWAHNKYGRAYGEETMRAYAWKPVLNSGVLAMRRDAPHWEAWAEDYRLALRGDPTIWVNQISLNHAVYSRNLECELLPAWCNWVCARGLPAHDPETGDLVEPFVPHRRLGIVHMAWNTKRGEHELVTTDGGTVRRSLRYPTDEEESGHA